jgi:alpha-ketoglutarate-dependent 2,4-dichlorophenoxyacetate dioxygenase
MAIIVMPKRDGFVAEIQGVDCSRPLGEDMLAELIDTLDRYAVAIFRDQSLSQAEQVTFVRRLGPLDTTLDEAMKTFQTRMDFAEVHDISNVDLSGEVARQDSRQAMMNISNRIWHTDASFMHFPWRYTTLYSVVAVAHGGETQWADLRAAYDALDDYWKVLVEPLIAEHFAQQSRMVLGYTDTSAAEFAMWPPVRWPMVRTHPATGRKLLFATHSIREVMGMTLPAGRQLVQDLIEHATQREFVYTHKWAPGDFIIWDNRSVIHRGRHFDMSERREMHRVATVDDVGSLPIDEDSRTKVYGQPCL